MSINLQILANRHSQILLLLGLMALFYTAASGQELRSYLVACDQAQFDYLIAHPEENVPVDCSLEYDGQTWPDACLSLRSGSYIYFLKKSFRIDFNDEDPFLGRDQMNLMAEWTDSSFCRQYLAYDLFQRARLPAPLAWFARLYVNDIYMGLYLDVEEIDEHFLLRAGLAEDASIYRADTTGCLLAASEQVEELWVKVTNIPTGHYDLNNLILWIETTLDELFFSQLADHFQPEELARVMAANALMGNQSTYYDNYILIHDLGQNGRWRLLPWEADSAFVYWSDYDDPQYYRCGHPLLEQTNALITRCWQDEDMLPLILDQMGGLMDSLFTQSYYQWITDTLALMLYDAVLEDTLKQFGTDEFIAALADIPIHVANRSTNLEYRMEHEPLPFNLHSAFLTPNGVYFSWERTFIADGSPVTYAVKIADNPLLSGDVDSINTGGNTSLLYSDILPGEYYWRAYAYSPSNEEVRSLAFFSPFEVPEGAFSGTVVTGTISSSTTWDVAGSPYSLPEGLTVDSGAVLTIEPGVLVGIGADSSIVIYGGLTAIGTAEDSIHFVPLNPDSNWGAFLIFYPTHEINMGFVSIIGGSNAPVGQQTQAMIKIGYGQVCIYDSYLGMGACGAIVASYTDIQIERVLFDHLGLRPFGITWGSAIARSCRFLHTSQEAYGLLELNYTSDSCEVSRCEFYGTSDDAIDLDIVFDTEISRNFITGAQDKGISVGEECENVIITNNIFTDCSIGISIYTSTDAVLYNNLCLFNGIGLSINEPGGSGEVVIRNSVLWHNNEDIQICEGANLTVEYCQTGGEEPYPGQGNINTDPNFMDLWNGNYYPLETSPLIDAGYGTGHPELDFNDSARVDIAAIPNTGAGEITYVDIGVYEYYPQEPVVNPPVQTSPYRGPVLTLGPNPFNAVTKINFSLQHYGWAEISIYDILGRLVFERRFVRLLPGRHSLLWNARNQANAPVASGMYFCRLNTQFGSRTTKMVLLK